MRRDLQYYSPWRLDSVSPLLRLILAWGLFEGIRNGFYVGYLTIHGPEIGINIGLAGLALAVNLYTDSFGRSIGGYLTQRFGLGAVCLVAALVGAVLIFVTPQFPSPVLLVGLSALWGVSMSGIMPGLMTLSSRIAVEGREGRSVTIANTLTTPWSGIGTFGIALVAKSNPELALQILQATVCVVIILGLTLIFRPEKVRAATPALFPWRRLLLFIPAAFAQTFAPAMLGFLILRYARELGISGTWLIALVVVGGALSIGLVLVTGRYADRKSPRELLVAGLVLIGIAMFWLGTSPSLLEAFAIAVLVGIGFGCFGPAWSALVVRVLPEHNRAAAWGTIMMVEGLGHAIAPAAAGFLVINFSIHLPFYVSGVIFMALAVFYLVLLWRPSWK